MTTWSTVFLAVIAAATGAMALIQVGIILYGVRLARRIGRLVDRLEHDVDPLLAQVHQIADDASWATKIAATQVERADEVVTRLVDRAEETLDVVHEVVVAPAKHGLALLEALSAVLVHLQRPAPATRATGGREGRESAAATEQDTVQATR
ncbi:MAG: hypothetical protein VYE68_03840 [Acidobacteriota bacterium]|nr:hypothetical protein [Acidobacteriota bacterium]